MTASGIRSGTGIGSGVRRPDGVAKVQGQFEFANDLWDRGMRQCVRSNQLLLGQEFVNEVPGAQEPLVDLRVRHPGHLQISAIRPQKLELAPVQPLPHHCSDFASNQQWATKRHCWQP